MASRALSRTGTVTISLNREETFTLSDLARIAFTDPALLPAAAAVARRFHPRTTLAREA